MNSSQLALVRTAVEKVVRCLSGDVLSTSVVFAGPQLGMAIVLKVRLSGQTYNATIGTAAGIGPESAFTGVDPAAFEQQLYTELESGFKQSDLTGLTVVFSAQHRDPEQFLPVAKMDANSTEVRAMSDEMVQFLRRAATIAINRAVFGGSASLRVTAPGKQWPVWILVDAAPGSNEYSAVTNDVDLMVPSPPAFFSKCNTSDALVVAMLQYLAEEFIDAPETSILVRSFGDPNMVGDSRNGESGIAEEPAYDV